MAQFTKENGLLSRMEKVRRMVEVFRYGQMVHVMMASGAMAWPMAMADLFTLKVTFTRVSGPRIKRMDMVFIHISTEVDMKVSGLPISSMVSVLSNGPMVPNTMVNTNRV